MTRTVPLFPLNAVTFPGAVNQLHIFEDRYQELVADLLRITEPRDRVFGLVGIRSGFEVGDMLGADEIHEVGTLVHLVSSETNPDNTLDITLLARDRFEINSISHHKSYLTAQIADRDAITGSNPDRAAEKALAAFVAYRTQLSEFGAPGPYDEPFPSEATELSWKLAAQVMLGMDDRQRLLEIDTADTRLDVLRELLGVELSAMRVVPSLPANDFARQRWSPN